MSDNHLILHKGKEKALRNRHHWIFSGAVKHLPQVENGSVVEVYSCEREFLGIAYLNRKCSILGRMLSFSERHLTTVLEKAIRRAVALRQMLFAHKDTNAYRLVNSEGDEIPGLIVDQYNDVLVMQISTLGIEKLKKEILEILIKELNPKSILEKSTGPSRREEGLRSLEAVHWGEPVPSVEIRENGLRLAVNLETGQKTGFFLDQREMRSLVESFAQGRRVLNCFSYTGGFSVAALRGGAASVHSVDISESAIEEAKNNCALNGYSDEKNEFSVADVFTFLREKKNACNFVILDPPAFAKKKQDVIPACRGYKEINRLALAGVPSQSLVLTSSCSHHVDEKLFQQVVFQAAGEASRSVRILERHRLAPDHPVNIFHPEGSYLKSLLLYVE
ncbi:MAG: class I SAM-dependent rRNA methyltransferase [Blastocatellia bacterium]|nr:class I SAM-dependent rRNA methyltransferase [Blastocatellia bacterium]